jgi:hypothetical protein
MTPGSHIFGFICVLNGFFLALALVDFSASTHALLGDAAFATVYVSFRHGAPVLLPIVLGTCTLLPVAALTAAVDAWALLQRSGPMLFHSLGLLGFALTTGAIWWTLTVSRPREFALLEGGGLAELTLVNASHLVLLWVNVAATVLGFLRWECTPVGVSVAAPAARKLPAKRTKKA